MPGPCRFCDRPVPEGTDRCPHCGGRYVPGARRSVVPPAAAGRAAEVARQVGEARLFLVGMGALLLLLWTSATLTGTEGFRSWEARQSLFYFLVAHRHVFGLIGAGLLTAGGGFWATNRLGYAYAGGLLWLALVLSPLLLLLFSAGAGDLTTELDGEHVAGAGSLLPALFAWATVATLPLYYFRELGRLRRAERADPEAEG
ncbi:MAG: hypothetical protein KF878_03320 [Planctomycetes bacterium]|nr:hypothetical protein [Planctomycetota bacterium]